MKRFLMYLIGIFCLSLVLAGCAAAPPTPTPTPEPVEVTVALTDFNIEASQTTFEVGQVYRFIVTNNGALNHEFMIMPPVEDNSALAPTEEAEGGHMGGDDDGMGEGGMTMEEMDSMALAMIEEDELAPGTTQTIEVTFTEAAALGEMEFACHVPGHYPAGMKQFIAVQ